MENWDYFLGGLIRAKGMLLVNYLCQFGFKISICVSFLTEFNSKFNDIVHDYVVFSNYFSIEYVIVSSK